MQNLAKEIRARDSTIKELADKLSETAEAAEAAASAAQTMNEQRKIACAQVDHLKGDSEKQLELSKSKVLIPYHCVQLYHVYHWRLAITSYSSHVLECYIVAEGVRRKVYDPE